MAVAHIADYRGSDTASVVDCGGWALEGATSDRSRCGVNIAASVNMVI